MSLQIARFLTATVVAAGLVGLSPVVSAHAQVAPASTAPAPAPAADVMTAAKKQARASNKSILVVFHASWCGWCKRLDANVFDDPTVGKLLSDQYVIVHLDVLERNEKKALENAGADALMTRLGGAKAGLPFYAVLNASGVKQTDSLRMPKGENIGYPGSPAEIAAFVDILKTTAKRLPDADRQQIADHLAKNAPKT